VYVGLFLVFLAVLGAFFAGYWRFIRYERRALQHVPVASVFALRLDLQPVVLFEPVRRHLFPLLEKLSWGSSGLARVEAASGVNLSMDLRELVLATQADGRWLLVAGGLFDAAKLEQAAAAVLNQSTPGKCHALTMGFDCGEFSFAAAKDGTLLVGSESALVTQGEVVTPRYQSLNVNDRAAASWGLDVQSAAAGGTLGAITALRALGLTHARGELDLSDPLGVTVELTSDNPFLRGDGVRALGQLLPAAARGEVAVLLGDAEVVTIGNITAIRTKWSRAAMIEAFERAATWIGQR
jgi:hypothetical protein